MTVLAFKPFIGLRLSILLLALKVVVCAYWSWSLFGCFLVGLLVGFNVVDIRNCT